MTAPGTNPGTDLGTRPPLTGAGTVAGHPRWRRVFPGRDDQVREVRHWLAGLLPGAPERDDVVMVAVELATNAIRHTASGRGGFARAAPSACPRGQHGAVRGSPGPGGVGRRHLDRGQAGRNRGRAAPARGQLRFLALRDAAGVSAAILGTEAPA